MKTLNKHFATAFTAVIFGLLLFSCSTEYEAVDDKKPVARVFEDYLYQEDLNEVIQQPIEEADSIILAESYIDQWVKSRLILKKAELNLSSEQKNFDNRLEDYRQKLIIYSYRQKFIEQKLDTNVVQADIVRYYNENMQGFLLNRNVVKAVFVKIPLTTPNLYRARTYIRSSEAIDSVNLNEFASQFADAYDNFNDKWHDANKILAKLPIAVSNTEHFLRNTRTIDTRDTAFQYLVRFYDYKLLGEPEPIYFVENKIKQILLTKRKQTMIQELEKGIYEDAIKHRTIQFYTQ